MADHWKKNVLCRFFVNSSCRNGSRCPYSHDRTLQRPQLPCKFFQRGTCANGAQCAYLHEPPASPADSTSPSQAVPSAAPSAASPGTSRGAEARDTDCAGTASASASSHKPAATMSSSTRVKRGVTGGPGSGTWAEAPEFVPSNTYQPRSVCDGRQFSEVVGAGSAQTDSQSDSSSDLALLPLCPYAAVGECRYGEHCALLHGLMCEYCQCRVLHPYDGDQRRAHHKECLSQLEHDMEHSFRMADSSDKMCGICMELVVEKSGSSLQRFGILPGCNHCFCVACIRQWRASEQFESKVTRGCPECRVHSDFVCPSRYWVHSADEKRKLLDDYIKSCSEKPCRHFNEGRGECPFGDKCFFKHVYPDGAKARLGPPRRRKRQNHTMESEIMREVFLSEFLADIDPFDSDEDEDAFHISLRLDRDINDLLNEF